MASTATEVRKVSRTERRRLKPAVAGGGGVEGDCVERLRFGDGRRHYGRGRVGLGTFYHHFESKDAILAAIVADIAESSAPPRHGDAGADRPAECSVPRPPHRAAGRQRAQMGVAPGADDVTRGSAGGLHAAQSSRPPAGIERDGSTSPTSTSPGGGLRVHHLDGAIAAGRTRPGRRDVHWRTTCCACSAWPTRGGRDRAAAPPGAAGVGRGRPN